MDLKKSFFGTVNHKILREKLYIYGIRGNILKWFKSYPNERQQYVNLQGTESQIKCVTCGVPQGLIIGPLLFILFIDNMNNVSKKIFPILFADDTTVLIERYGYFFKARKVLKKGVLHQLYYSYMFPYLIDCSEVWGTASQNPLQPLIKLQEKIIRIISFSPYNSPTKPIFEHLEILPFKKTVFHRIGLQMYKYEYCIIPVALQYLFTKTFCT